MYSGGLVVTLQSISEREREKRAFKEKRKCELKAKGIIEITL